MESNNTNYLYNNYILSRKLPSKHKTFAWQLYNVETTSKTLGRRCINANILCLLGICRLVKNRTMNSDNIVVIIIIVQF